MPSSLLAVLFVAAHIQGNMATDTITTTTPLSGKQKLISKGNKFVLGFYSPTQDGDAFYKSNYYIAIWYSHISKVTTVWTTNTNAPVSDPAKASLSLSADGNLVLLDKIKNRHVWSTNVSISTNSTVATILDSGSLVLSDASNSSKVYWRSIDHPTNTWLPGGKLGINKITGVNQRLTAWRSNIDPSAGMFSLLLDPKGTTQYLMQWNNSVSYWTSGRWNGQVFSLVPEMNTKYRVRNYQFINNNEESYFTYSIPEDNSMVLRTIMDTDGLLKQLVWLNVSQIWTLFWSEPRTRCEVYKLCGPYGSCNPDDLPFCSCIKGFNVNVQSDWEQGVYSGGCKRAVPLHCQTNLSSATVDTDKFYAIAGVKLPDNAMSANAGSPEDCQVTCFNNCSCSAYTYNSTGCFVWHGDLVNLQEQYHGDGGGTLLLRLAASELPVAARHKATLIVIVAGGVVAVLLILAVLTQRRCCCRESVLQVFEDTSDRLTTFQYSDLQHATNNFSVKLGGGAFGSVFKGQLPAGSTPIAVKRLDGFQQGEKQFRAEVATVGMINHVNLVRLLGFCAEKTSRLLVYEYMEEGSLDSLLFRNDSSATLDWKTRYNIAMGIARGLAYMHDQCRECIIHCDLKPENVLLNANLQAKVADFGLAKILGHDFSCVLTTMRGTVGYLAPEWFSGLQITSKIDVYSFGMMLFELISGRRNTFLSESDTSSFFPCWAAIQVIDGNERSILDHRLEGVADKDELVRASRLACWCIQYEADRPSMALVVKMMEGLIDVDVPPFPGPLCCLLDSQVSSLTDVSHSDHDPS